jgi:thymidylate synthase ThyX
MIQAKVIADSKNEFGNRITTMVVTMPRIILAEFNTHRMFSRNSASSRAIPFEKMVKMVKSVEENPFVPIAWQKDHKGMQGTEYFTDENKEVLLRRGEWLKAKKAAINCALRLHTQDVTKQLCNRLLEPFMWHTVIVTATEWENFFALRCPRYQFKGSDRIFRSRRDVLEFVSDDPEYYENLSSLSILEWLKMNKGQAEIHMMALAEAMWDAYNESTPKELRTGEWHIPFGDDILIDAMKEQEDGTFDDWEVRVKIATARCAQVSYTVVGEEGKPMNYEKLIALHDRLSKSGHWSPFEHCARVMNSEEFGRYGITVGDGKKFEWQHGWSGNFRGFIQYRKMFENENIQVR